MDRENFTEGSIFQIIFDYWNKRIRTENGFKRKLMLKSKAELADFIIQAQSQGIFGNGYIHE